MRRAFWKVLRWILFQFDAETAHLVSLRLLRMGIALKGVPLRIASGSAPKLAVRPKVFGVEFQSRLGLAAGFDKNAEILEGLPDLGFGFAEIGTVTPRLQPGNPLPRLFRKPEDRALFNRMGFNSLGAEIVSKRLALARKKLPSGFRVGVNLGKNKETPLTEAADDYAHAALPFEGLADYLVINVSSPNTPGLRTLQTAESLLPIVVKVDRLISKWSFRPPLLLKIAPELSGEALSTLFLEARSWNIQGWVIANTLSAVWTDGLAGGLSGAPLTEISRQRLADAKQLTSLPIISVGGILSADEGLKRLQLGADLIQIYSGWILEGPTLPVAISRKISRF